MYKLHLENENELHLENENEQLLFVSHLFFSVVLDLIFQKQSFHLNQAFLEFSVSFLISS